MPDLPVAAPPEGRPAPRARDAAQRGGCPRCPAPLEDPPANGADRNVWASLLAGAVSSLVGVVGFGAAHALLIAPIWRNLAGVIPFALVGGTAAGWAFEELHASGRLGRRVRDGLLLGALLWLALIPVTGFAAVMRASGLRPAMGPWEIPSEVLLAALSGALAGWVVARRRRAIVCFAAATVVLTVVTGGPIPAANSPPAALLFAGFLVIFALCGAMLVTARAGLLGLRRA